MVDQESKVLTKEFLDKLKSELIVNPYTDEQLHRAAFFMVAPVMYNAGEIGAADASTKAILVTANLYAGALLAKFINAGCVSVSAIDRFMESTAEEAKTEDTTPDDDVRTDGDN